jgi:predicted dehydrogenase
MKAGVIGLGHGSRVLISAFQLSNIEVYGIASKNNWKAEKVRKEKKIKIAYKNWRELIKDKKINIVAIAVPAFIIYKITNLSFNF